MQDWDAFVNIHSNKTRLMNHEDFKNKSTARFGTQVPRRELHYIVRTVRKLENNLRKITKLQKKFKDNPHTRR